MNTRMVFAVFALLAPMVACGPAVTAPESGGGKLATVGGGGSGDPGGGGGGVGGDLGAAIDDVQQHLTDLDAQIAKARAAIDDAAKDDPAADEALLALEADRVASASFLADLQACAGGAADRCPPKLDEPTVPADGATPPALAELAADACACRTRACADWVLDALDTLGDQTSDDGAAQETQARECVNARLGTR